LVPERGPGDVQGREDRPERDRARPLDVVVEREGPIPVLVEDRTGVLRPEILPLQERPGESLANRPDEPTDELVVLGAGDPFVAPPEVLGVAQAVDVVRPDVEHDRQGPLGPNAADEGVEGELADRDPETADPLVPDPEDPFAVRDDDGVHLPVRSVLEERRDRLAQRIGDEQSARPSVDVAELLASLSDDRRVDDRHHLLHVVDEETVEQYLVGVLERPQVDVPLEIVGLPAVRLVGPDGLLVKRLDLRRQ
jgi:hypothetical protein